MCHLLKTKPGEKGNQTHEAHTSETTNPSQRRSLQNFTLNWLDTRADLPASTACTKSTFTSTQGRVGTGRTNAPRLYKSPPKRQPIN
jgi:hypothetical protein